MEIVKTRKAGLIVGFTIFISLYLVLINLFLSAFVDVFAGDKAWIPQVLLLILLPYILSTINQVMKDRLFSIINNAFAISIAIYVSYFAFNLMTMAARNTVTMSFTDIQNYLALPSYGLISLLIFMVISRFAVRYKAGFHVIFGVGILVTLLAFVGEVDTSLYDTIIQVTDK